MTNLSKAPQKAYLWVQFIIYFDAELKELTKLTVHASWDTCSENYIAAGFFVWCGKGDHFSALPCIILLSIYSICPSRLITTTLHRATHGNITNRRFVKWLPSPYIVAWILLTSKELSLVPTFLDHFLNTIFPAETQYALSILLLISLELNLYRNVDKICHYSHLVQVYIHSMTLSLQLVKNIFNISLIICSSFTSRMHKMHF